LWQRLPDELEPPDFERRLAFLRSEVRTGERALDVGCGAGEFTAALAQAGASAVGVDVAESALERAWARHPGVDFRLVAIDGPLPFEDCTFTCLVGTLASAAILDCTCEEICASLAPLEQATLRESTRINATKDSDIFAFISMLLGVLAALNIRCMGAVPDCSAAEIVQVLPIWPENPIFVPANRGRVIQDFATPGRKLPGQVRGCRF
jgi:SAM-dependent methyltransferase